MQALPAEGWVEGMRPRRAAVLGRHAGFEWLGFEGEGSAPAFAARLARRLERAGRLAAVLVLDPAAHQLVLSVSFGARPLLAVDLDRPSALARRCVERLAGAGGDGTLTAAAHIAHALDAEEVGRRFFAGFRQLQRRMATALPPRLPAEDREALVLLQLIRVLFLYFVQAKGWLDGRTAFLREQLDRVLAGGGRVQDRLLKPLFFGTLNQPAIRRGATARQFGRVPFLNGGLFEPHPLERQWSAAIPDELWRDGFDQVFERFEFTLGEDDGRRIAPDMLGRVFEGLMAPETRSESGTFYTPARLVDAVVHAALAAFLARRLDCGEPEAERRLAEPDGRTRAALAPVTVLDPAVGSGAFLLGALERLAAAHGGPAAAARRAVLARNLFGVDLNPAAVRLTELRLWLAVIERDDTPAPDRVAPLPNLDSMIRQGDSLLEPVIPGWGGAPPPEAAAELAELREALARSTGREKAALVRALRRCEAAVAETMLRRAEASTRGHIADLLAQGRSPTLFEARRGLTPAERHTVQALRARRRFLYGLRRRLARDGALPWFHYQSQFGDVFSRGGFDLVIGNPPWVRAEELAPAMRRHLRARYRWWSGEAGGAGYAHQPDLSVAFLERAAELAAPNGTIGFLLPAKLATASYGATARAGVAERMTLHAVADLAGDPRAVFEATTYPLAVVASRGAPDQHHRVRLALETGSPRVVPQLRLRNGPWLLAGERVAGALERVRGDHPLLGARFRCHLGVKTGFNEAFLDPSLPVEPELLVWAVRGRDVRPFTVRADARLLWTHAADGRPLRALPPLAAAYLARHRTALRARRDYDGGPEWTLFRTVPAMAPHRVVWADMAPFLAAAALTGPQADRFIPLNTCYLIPADRGPIALRLTAWLNCGWIRAAAASVADPAAGGFRRFNARVVSGLPLPEPVLRDPALLAFAEAGRAGRLDQAALDDHCARLLALTPEDRRALADAEPSSGHRR